VCRNFASGDTKEDLLLPTGIAELYDVTGGKHEELSSRYKSTKLQIALTLCLQISILALMAGCLIIPLKDKHYGSVLGAIEARAGIEASIQDISPSYLKNLETYRFISLTPNL
jgi:hypothetical protein